MLFLDFDYFLTGMSNFDTKNPKETESDRKIKFPLEKNVFFRNLVLRVMNIIVRATRNVSIS